MIKCKYYILIFLFSLSGSAFSDEQPLVEIHHWWSSAGELSALKEIEKSVKENGGAFEATSIDRLSYVEVLIEQASLGYLPGATHWLGGKMTKILKEKNIISYVPGKINGQFFKDFLHEEVYQDINDDGHIMSLPVGIHLQNRAYYNRKIYDELNLQAPDGWMEFIEQAKIIKAAGYTPLALSTVANQSWQVRNLMDSTMVGLHGSAFFVDFYDEMKSIEDSRAQLVTVFDLFLSLKAYVNKSHANNKWNENVHALAQGQAAAYFLGDYSKGELVAKEGLLPGKDFYCDFAPGNRGVHIYGIDSFALLNIKNQRLIDGQSLLIKTVLDPKVQAAYITRKGGIPVRKDVTLENLDACSTKSYAEWLDPDTVRLPYAAGYSKARLSAMQKSAVDLWNDPDPDVGKVVDELIKTFNLMERE